jgi:hypothetical protein
MIDVAQGKSLENKIPHENFLVSEGVLIVRRGLVQSNQSELTDL